MLRTGDFVVIRKEAPGSVRPDWWNGLMDVYKDGISFYLVRVDEDAEGFTHLTDAYKHGIKTGQNKSYDVEDFTWHSSWLQQVSTAARVPDREEVVRKPGLYYSDRHEIIGQQPGESDKAYLRRILGGR